jgi:hypothetical protein
MRTDENNSRASSIIRAADMQKGNARTVFRSLVTVYCHDLGGPV